ncbi:hypothetical protein EBN88_16500 [Streptomyces triticirhizae]|uniref:Alpha/beta fold hydrolase n=1 Tax=Streptomyces triticirhizae TaxID=2483353 RepID=A0A3M2LP38_9ACTN|nr:hypothetical protein EBN88_16500 [Streptomyces triticirhizae]
MLNDVGSNELILASDFPATGRTIPGFADLVAKLRPHRQVWETAPPPAGTETGLHATDYVDAWLADVRESGLRVTAVLGYCVGGVFAAPLAEHIASWQDEPPAVILFDPERPDGALIHRHYHELVAGLSSVLSTDEIQAAQERGRKAREQHDDLPALAAELSSLFADVGEVGFTRVGLDPARRGELVATFRGFVHYLVVAAEVDPVPVWRRATAVSSHSPLNGLNVLGAEERDTIVARDIRFALDHGDLLRDDDVVRHVADALDGTPTGAR